ATHEPDEHVRIVPQKQTSGEAKGSCEFGAHVTTQRNLSGGLHGQGFMAKLQKGLEGLGLTVRLHPDLQTGVLVVDVHPQGSVAKYNTQQRASGSSMLIRPRMLITEVNGIQGNAEAMLEALCRSLSLQLRLRAASATELAERKHASPKEIVSMMNAIRAVRILQSTESLPRSRSRHS
ncbi:FAZ1, partial [Symbiodinium pilosum]